MEESPKASIVRDEDIRCAFSPEPFARAAEDLPDFVEIAAGNEKKCF